MDGCSVAALLPSIEQAKTWLSAVGSVVIAASVLTSITPTPEPGTRLARIYRYVELSALLFGRAKDRGLLPKMPQIDKPLADAIALVKSKGPS